MQERLGIIGSGTIACGLAKTAAEHGEVVLWARSDESAERARAKAGDVEVVTDFAALTEATFLVECVAEDPEIKGPLLGELGELAGPEAIVATTTSSLPLALLEQATGRPGRFCAFHVFNPVPKMPLVELAFPEDAEPDVRERALTLCEHLGKTGVEVPGRPRLRRQPPALPLPLLRRGPARRDRHGPSGIDACMKLGAGHPMGPLALLDLVGLDVSQAIAEAIGIHVPARVRASRRRRKARPEGQVRFLRI